jgi:hypothetical protein
VRYRYVERDAFPRCFLVISHACCIHVHILPLSVQQYQFRVFADDRPSLSRARDAQTLLRIAHALIRRSLRIGMTCVQIQSLFGATMPQYASICVLPVDALQILFKKLTYL